MLIVSSIEEPSVLVLKTAGDRAQAAFPHLQCQMRFVLRDVARMQPRTFHSQCHPQQLQYGCELGAARNNSPVRNAAQSDVVPAKWNGRKARETRHHWLLHD